MMNMKNILIASACAISAIAAPIQKRIDPNPNLAVDLPLYSWPTDGAWDGVYSTLSSFPNTQFNIIVNPDSGPGTYPPNSDYIIGVAKLNSYSNAHIYGYVRTGFTDRPVSDVQADVETYKQWNSHQGADIHLDGIFVDEAPDNLQHLEYMQNVHAAITNALPASAKIWTNPGCIVDASFYDYADRITAFESDFDAWMNPDRETIPWDLHSKTSVMIIDYSGQADGPAAQAQILVERGFQSGFLYGTEGYQDFSSTWQQFAQALGGDEKNGTY